jgi:hypothetical protein
MIKRKKYEQAFLDGYKPGVLSYTNSPFFQQLKSYPYISPFDHEEESGIFFQTDQQKREYLELMKDVPIEFGSYQFHYNVGIALGFPEKSVKYYSEMRVLEEQTGEYPVEEERLKVGIHWAGFSFSSYLPWLIEDVEWMWKQYNHPKAIECPFYLRSKKGYKEIQYGDFATLEEVRKYIMAERGLIPSVI